MFNQLFDLLPKLKKDGRFTQSLLSEVHVRAKTILLKEGEIPRKVFFVKKGCLRASLNSRGKEITFQFFFENDVVASIESFRANRPSPFSIHSIEPSTLLVLQKEGFDILMRELPEFKDILFEIAIRRFSQYSRLFLSYLRNPPRQRYLELLNEEPHIIKRIPQHYIASYLGITPVSLSRIRKRI